MTRLGRRNPAQKKPNSPKEQSDQTLGDHLRELRKRVFYVAATLVVVSAVGFQYKDHVISAVMDPLHGQKLIYLTPGGGFSFIFTVCLYFGLLLTIPVAVYQTFRFLQPLVGLTSRRLIAVFIFLSGLLAAAGALFGYFVTIPAALTFLSTFAGDTVIPSLTAESYLNFVVSYVLGLAILFQLPLLLFLLDHVNPFKPGFLSSTQDKIIIAATVLAAIITPTPDAFNMALVAMPIVIMYELGVVAVLVRRRFRKTARHVVERSVELEGDKLEDEPLAALIADLNRPKKTMEDLEGVPAHVAARPVPIQAQQKTDFEMPVLKPQPVPVYTPQPQQPQQQSRPIDGFVRAPRPAPNRIAVPARQQPVPRPAAQAPATTRPFRSIDGFTPVSQASS